MSLLKPYLYDKYVNTPARSMDMLLSVLLEKLLKYLYYKRLLFYKGFKS